MTYSLPLIDKQDNFEIIRDKIAAILATETAAQQVLATAGGKDATLWAFDVYKERGNPWDKFIKDTPTNTNPIVHVWYDSGNADKASSNISSRQKVDSTYNIDIVGYGVSVPDGSGGHIPGDRAAALACQRAARLVRNILMSDKYKNLELTSPQIWQRWISNAQSFQPQSGTQPIAHLVGLRFSFIVTHNESTVLADGQTIELINVDIKNDADGSVVAELDIE
jgi:hypothetical protein